jgi:hypothetical protein
MARNAGKSTTFQVVKAFGGNTMPGGATIPRMGDDVNGTQGVAQRLLQGALIGEYARQINCSQPVWWNVATIVWGSTATLQETNVMETDVGHGVCR